jgi:hypothetical protein
MGGLWATLVFLSDDSEKTGGGANHGRLLAPTDNIQVWYTLIMIQMLAECCHVRRLAGAGVQP